MHHDGVHAVGHGEGLEVGLDGDRQRELVDEVDRRARHNGSAAEILETKDCRWKGGRGGGGLVNSQPGIYDENEPPDRNKQCGASR